jgi:glutathione S-transferase
MANDAPATLVLQRWLAAPPERVFDAFARQGQMERWMCRDAGSHVIHYVKFDFREGGECVLDIDIGKGQRYLQYLRYKTIVRPRRIVWVWEGEQLDASGKMIDELRGTVVTIVLTDSRGGTELTLTHEFLPNAQSFRDHRRGWDGCIDVLASLLAADPAFDVRHEGDLP